jgi:hypothetical protein
MPVLQVDGADLYEAELRAALAHAAGQRSPPRCRGLGHGLGWPHRQPFPRIARHSTNASAWSYLNDGDRVTPPRPRMTMTYPLLGGAHLIALLVTGASKHWALKQAAQSPSDFHVLPVVGLVPGPDSRLLWFLDRAAAADSDTSTTGMSG